MNQQIFQVERKRLADQVADQLMTLIANGELKPGDKLPSEPELMKQFQVQAILTKKVTWNWIEDPTAKKGLKNGLLIFLEKN